MVLMAARSDADDDPAKREIWKGVRALWQDGCICELRALKTKKHTLSGYFDDPKLLAKCAYDLDRLEVPATYVTLNPVAPDLFARAPNRVLTYVHDTTQDVDIVRRTRMLVDLDAKRPSGISATDAQHDAALERARSVRDYLCESGWPAPLFVDSGNGAHLICEVDLSNDTQARDELRGFLKMLARRFSDEMVEVDQTVYNAARIVKLPGTMARKGSDMPDRPHRRSRILELPDGFGGAHE